MPHRLLLHLAGTCDARDPRLRDALALHLHHQPLTLVLVAHEGDIRTYVALDGCGACQEHRCGVGCHLDLLRRVLAAYAPDIQARVVGGQGLAPQPLTRRARLHPVQPRLLTAADVAARWPTARVVLTWAGGPRGLRVGGWIGAGVLGPDWSALRDLGWRARRPLVDIVVPSRGDVATPALPPPERPTNATSRIPDLRWADAEGAPAAPNAPAAPSQAGTRGERLRAALATVLRRRHGEAGRDPHPTPYVPEGHHGTE